MIVSMSVYDAGMDADATVEIEELNRKRVFKVENFHVIRISQASYFFSVLVVTNNSEYWYEYVYILKLFDSLLST